jgi:hypothetical protein
MTIYGRRLSKVATTPLQPRRRSRRIPSVFWRARLTWRGLGNLFLDVCLVLLSCILQAGKEQAFFANSSLRFFFFFFFRHCCLRLELLLAHCLFSHVYVYVKKRRLLRTCSAPPRHLIYTLSPSSGSFDLLTSQHHARDTLALPSSSHAVCASALQNPHLSFTHSLHPTYPQ